MISLLSLLLSLGNPDSQLAHPGHGQTGHKDVPNHQAYGVYRHLRLREYRGKSLHSRHQCGSGVWWEV